MNQLEIETIEGYIAVMQRLALYRSREQIVQWWCCELFINSDITKDVFQSVSRFLDSELEFKK